MNIYVEYKLGRLRLKTGEEEIEVEVQKNFYSSIPGTESFEMFRDEETIMKLSDFISRHRNKLGPLAKVNYWFFRNRVLSLVDKDVQERATIGQLYVYGTLYLDGRIVSIIKKPETFDSGKLESIELIDNTALNRRGKIIGDVIISKLG
ncbi:hypothetical protein [Chryseolinea sp. H1M3-3]|uniref:hypothetical protein n=1 Tax=Chryseolinea sp. H1M3-3 TaxID=3034144 RepID=UPI0023ECBA42|nr:hypothetical protein [Chryseolinea sp. H1M3-3]